MKITEYLQKGLQATYFKFDYKVNDSLLQNHDNMIYKIVVGERSI